MFLHIGNDVYLPEKDIIAIMNLDTASVSKNTQVYLHKNELKGKVETICEDIPKTFVVTRKNNKDKVYLTNISSATLIKRAENDSIVNFESEE
ncbi:MAG: DUF370 domain-containing protein [Spirochaetaceae bacterium]|nr:DUF370 domain-containing protein [Spirochaetaceae bacterium]